MTLAHTLARQGHAPRRITAAAKATFGIVGDVRLIQRSELDVAVDADGLGEADLSHAAELAGRYCPVSNTLRLAGTELAVSTRVAGG
jgi:organic hydroperoxide reductase OsmC/OhrA